MVADNFCFVGGSIAWDFCFRRNSTDVEASDFMRLLGMLLDKSFLLVGKGDSRIWKPDVKGNFSMRSFLKDFAC